MSFSRDLETLERLLLRHLISFFLCSLIHQLTFIHSFVMYLQCYHISGRGRLLQGPCAADCAAQPSRELPLAWRESCPTPVGLCSLWLRSLHLGRNRLRFGT